MIQLRHGDKVAVVSLSAGTLGEAFCSHQLARGVDRLETFDLEVVFMPHALKGLEFIKTHPKKRAEDLLMAFQDDSIKGILCAIGGEDTFKLAPYLLSEESQAVIREHPKFFMGYSDTTINHLMLNKLGVPSFYGLSFLTCFAELGETMLAYSAEAFSQVFTKEAFVYQPSERWFEERMDFSEQSLGLDRAAHQETRGYELLQGSGTFSGQLIGGCVESLYELLVGERYPEEKAINETYQLFPSKSQLADAVVFLETSEERPTPEKFKDMLLTLREAGLFDGINGVLVGKPQDEVFYEEYKTVLIDCLEGELPIVYNLNFGHAYPKMLMQYGALAQVDVSKQQVRIERV
ncbi:S66 family peptidase [Fundicoccus sp. Sow4_F4]|uniref:S66 family peptidase n=1 Tax=Fundicoccus sp. Sow4_F4 TaxID=3438783 RepID=UPI003F8E981F